MIHTSGNSFSVYVVIIRNISMRSEFVDSIYSNKQVAIDRAEAIQHDIGEDFLVEVEPHNVETDFLDTSRVV